MTALQITWFILFFVLIIGYAILDGFDLGVGILSLFSKSSDERRLHMNAIAPFWDGNEVWLLTGGGALFAAFPVVYATVFSSFYLAFMLLLFALIFRAVSLEFAHQVDSPKWESFWGWAFGISSFLPILLYGVAFGNILRGLPLDKEGVFTGTFFGLLNPYALVTGVLSVALFIMHGAAWLRMKTEGDLQERLGKWVSNSWIAFVVLYLIATVYTFFEARYLFEAILKNPIFWVLIITLMGSIVYIPIASGTKQTLRCFLASSTLITAMVGLIAISLFPRMVPSLTNLDYSLTISNSSSTYLTHKVMLIIALIGMPLVIGYTAFIYYIFKGKASSEAHY